jgi:hypothetical protein
VLTCNTLFLGIADPNHLDIHGFPKLLVLGSLESQVHFVTLPVPSPLLSRRCRNFLDVDGESTRYPFKKVRLLVLITEQPFLWVSSQSRILSSCCRLWAKHLYGSSRGPGVQPPWPSTSPPSSSAHGRKATARHHKLH